MWAGSSVKPHSPHVDVNVVTPLTISIAPQLASTSAPKQRTELGLAHGLKTIVVRQIFTSQPQEAVVLFTVEMKARLFVWRVRLHLLNNWCLRGECRSASGYRTDAWAVSSPSSPPSS